MKGKIMFLILMYTVKPTNKGQVGASTNVHYSEVVLYWGASAKYHLFYVVVHTNRILYITTVIYLIICNGYESTSKLAFVSIRKIQ